MKRLVLGKNTAAILASILASAQIEEQETKAQSAPEPDKQADDCDCVICRLRRSIQSETSNEEDGAMVQTIASFIVNNEIASVGFTAESETSPEVSGKVVIRFSEDGDTFGMTPDQARMIGTALVAAANALD